MERSARFYQARLDHLRRVKKALSDNYGLVMEGMSNGRLRIGRPAGSDTDALGFFNAAHDYSASGEIPCVWKNEASENEGNEKMIAGQVRGDSLFHISLPAHYDDCEIIVGVADRIELTADFSGLGESSKMLEVKNAATNGIKLVIIAVDISL